MEAGGSKMSSLIQDDGEAPVSETMLTVVECLYRWMEGRLKTELGSVLFDERVKSVLKKSIGIDIVRKSEDLIARHEKGEVVDKPVKPLLEQFFDAIKSMKKRFTAGAALPKSVNRVHKEVSAVVSFVVDMIDRARACPHCVINYFEATNDEDWFAKPCPKPHSLVWARTEGYPSRPAKLVALNGNGKTAQVAYFGTNTLDLEVNIKHDLKFLTRDLPRDYSKVTERSPALLKEFILAMNSLDTHIKKLHERVGGKDLVIFFPISENDYDGRTLFLYQQQEEEEIIPKISCVNDVFQSRTRHRLVAALVRQLVKDPRFQPQVFVEKCLGDVNGEEVSQDSMNTKDEREIHDQEVNDGITQNGINAISKTNEKDFSIPKSPPKKRSLPVNGDDDVRKRKGLVFTNEVLEETDDDKIIDDPMISREDLKERDTNFDEDDQEGPSGVLDSSFEVVVTPSKEKDCSFQDETGVFLDSPVKDVHSAPVQSAITQSRTIIHEEQGRLDAQMEPHDHEEDGVESATDDDETEYDDEDNDEEEASEVEEAVVQEPLDHDQVDEQDIPVTNHNITQEITPKVQGFQTQEKVVIEQKPENLKFILPTLNGESNKLPGEGSSYTQDVVTRKSLPKTQTTTLQARSPSTQEVRTKNEVISPARERAKLLLERDILKLRIVAEEGEFKKNYAIALQDYVKKKKFLKEVYQERLKRTVYSQEITELLHAKEKEMLLAKSISFCNVCLEPALKEFSDPEVMGFYCSLKCKKSMPN